MNYIHKYFPSLKLSWYQSLTKFFTDRSSLDVLKSSLARSRSVCLTPGHFRLRHQSFPRRLRHPHMPRISLSSRISPSRISNLVIPVCLESHYPLKLLHNTYSRVLVSSSTSVLVHFARIIGYRLYPAWHILPASRLVRRHLRPVCTCHPSSPLSYAAATPSCPDLDHQGVDLSSVSGSLIQTLDVLIHREFEGGVRYPYLTTRLDILILLLVSLSNYSLPLSLSFLVSIY